LPYGSVGDGGVIADVKPETFQVWPVREGQQKLWSTSTGGWGDVTPADQLRTRWQSALFRRA